MSRTVQSMAHRWQTIVCVLSQKVTTTTAATMATPERLVKIENDQCFAKLWISRFLAAAPWLVSAVGVASQGIPTIEFILQSW